MNLYDLSWKSNTFGGKLALFFGSVWENRRAFKFPLRWQPKTKECKEIADACVALASACYTIAASAFVRVKNNKTVESKTQNPLLWILLFPLDAIWCLTTWIPLGAICYAGMLFFCLRALNYVAYDNLSAGQLDVCQGVFRKWGYIGRARRCIGAGLAKETIKNHTAGLLWIARAEINIKERDDEFLGNCFHHALYFAKLAEKDEPTQASRIYRQCAELLKNVHDSACSSDRDLLLKRARDLAQWTDAKDQLSKLP